MNEFTKPGTQITGTVAVQKETRYVARCRACEWSEWSGEHVIAVSILHAHFYAAHPDDKEDSK